MIVGKTNPKKQDFATIWVNYQGKAKGKTYPKWPITLLEQYIIAYIIWTKTNVVYIIRQLQVSKTFIQQLALLLKRSPGLNQSRCQIHLFLIKLVENDTENQLDLVTPPLENPLGDLALSKQDLRSTAIYSVFLIIILDIYTTVSAFP